MAAKSSDTALSYGQLVSLLAENPLAFLSCSELATYLRVPAEVITMASGASDSPFIGKSCRPVWVVDWLGNRGGLKSK